MYNFDKIKVLLEAYKFTNEEEVYDALESNRIGVKILPEYKDKTKWGYACEKLRKFFKTCKELGIKDTTYGVQLLLSKVPPENLENVINTDGFYELLKSRNKQWVKELKEFQDIMNEKVWFGSITNDLHKFEKVVQNNQTNHGKSSKGSGNLKDVNVLYDDGTWKLMTVNTFEGAKAASFYNENGKEKTTSWCTRADIYYFNRYTNYGKNPLYIFRNLKNGKAYQMAFENDDSDDDVYIHFLDQDDEKGDEITQGDFSKLPDNLLKLVKSPFGNLKGKSLLDYKKAEETDPNEGKKGYVDKRKEKFKDAGYVDDKIVEKIVNKELDLTFEDFIEEFGRVKKQVSIGGAMQQRGTDKLNTYFYKGIKVVNNYGQKAGYRKYFFEKRPDIWITIVAKKNTKPVVYDSSKIDYENYKRKDDEAKSILHYVSFIDMGVDKIVKDENYGEIIIDKEEAKRRDNEKVYKDKTEKVIEMTKKDLAADMKKLGIQEILDKHAYTHVMPKDSTHKTYTDDRMPGREIMFSTEDAVYFSCFLKGTALKLENLVLKNNKQKKPSKELKEFALKLAKTYQRNWRRVFSYEVVQNRVEGNYKNIYEEKNMDFKKVIKNASKEKNYDIHYIGNKYIQGIITAEQAKKELEKIFPNEKDFYDKKIKDWDKIKERGEKQNKIRQAVIQKIKGKKADDFLAIKESYFDY